MEDLVEVYELQADMPVGVMDSGLGGISVLQKIRQVLPQENCIFFGDSAHAPYGDKSLAEIRQLTANVVNNRLRQRVKAVVLPVILPAVLQVLFYVKNIHGFLLSLLNRH